MNRFLFTLTILLVAVQMYALDVVFRYDDFRLIDNDFQNQLIEVFAKEQVPLHIAIIPFNQDSTPCIQKGASLNRVKELHHQGVLQIALHGFSHTGDAINGEFPLLSYEEQRFRLELGSRLLDSIFGEHIHIFIPPWNMYNQNTLNILADLGYDAISADLNTKRTFRDSRFQYYPEGAPHAYVFKEATAKNDRRDGLLVWMFHRYDFPNEISIDEMRHLLQKVKANKNLHIVTMDSLLVLDNSFNTERIETNLTHPLLTKILYTRPIILTTSEARLLRIYDILLWLFIVGLISFIGLIWIDCNKKKYLLIQSMVIIITGIQTWHQFVMPKIGLGICLLLCVCTIFCFSLLKKE